MQRDTVQLLRDRGIQPSAQRVAVADYVLHTTDHPSAEQVFSRVSGALPVLSRATVYNTLNLLVEKGLLRAMQIAEGRTVFDPLVDRHHHFVDEDTGQIIDVPWEAVRVSRIETLDGFDVREYQVVMRGRRTGSRRRG